MGDKEKTFDVGIIGCGPRGLSALESLYGSVGQGDSIPKTLIIEKSNYPGAGPIYGLDQPDTNWLNVSERGLDIWPRKPAKLDNIRIDGFPDFQEWSGYSKKEVSPENVDHFPFRSEMGKYLTHRFESIANLLVREGFLEFVQGEADRIDIENDLVKVHTIGGDNYLVHEAALCIGHQPITLDSQLSGWQSRVLELDNIELFTQPYPIDRLLSSAETFHERKIAIRGFGLAMIDVARAYTEGMGGEFRILDSSSRKMEYHASGHEPKEILAFSLDGLPMAPKPLNEKLDRLYVPSEEQLKNYRNKVKDALSIGPNSTEFLISAIVPIISRKFMELGDQSRKHELCEREIKDLIFSWLKNGDFSDDLIVSKKLTAKDVLEQFSGMATGQELVSLDYCIGHVWRHVQPTMYELLSFVDISDELIGDIVQLDERLKRYSYGPPVDSLQQLLALVDSGHLNLDFVKDPDISLEEEGYIFECDGQRKTVITMVNSVLDSPQILKVAAPLPKGLINSTNIEPVHDKLGLRTGEDALIQKTDGSSVPIAMMGRLAKGTLIGVDAIAECFGKRSCLWAEGFMKRFPERKSVHITVEKKVEDNL